MQGSKREAVAVIPAGGLGQRMKPFQTWKELIPLGYNIIEIPATKKRAYMYGDYSVLANLSDGE